VADDESIEPSQYFGQEKDWDFEVSSACIGTFLAAFLERVSKEIKSSMRKKPQEGNWLI